MDVSLGELRELVKDREAWRAAIHGVTKSRTWLSDWSHLKKHFLTYSTRPHHPSTKPIKYITQTHIYTHYRLESLINTNAEINKILVNQSNVTLQRPCSMIKWDLSQRFKDFSVFTKLIMISSILFSFSVMSDSLWPPGLQHAMIPCSSPIPRAYSDSCPSSRICHPTISSSVIAFISLLQSFAASGSFPMS